jgi:ABC-type transport system involved in cytochrome c biogenesis permease component
MPFLPIAERELRVAVHQPRTWWRRVMTTTVGLALFAFMFAVLGQFRGLLFIGRELFAALSWVGMIYALLAGPLTTADCLSRERRDGTLGLLFLTDLRSYDVVLGKMAAASLRIALDLTAVLPLAAIPMLMGGVSLTQVAVVAVAIVTIMFLSLAVGTCASALSSSGRSSLAITLGVLFFLTVGLELLGDAIPINGWAAPWFYMLCPISLMAYSVAGLLRAHRWWYWLNMGGIHLFSWICLVIAAWRIKNSWRDLPASARALRLNARFEMWRKGSATARQAWRRLMMNRNPVGWLEGRDRLQHRMLWGTILLAAITAAITHLVAPSKWPDEDWVILWAIFGHYILCVWIAIQAPRRLADDKESGALELLLCTPVKPAEIVRGSMMILRRRFGRALLALLVLDAFIGLAYFSEHGGWDKFRGGDLWRLAICALVVAPVQAYSLARIGIYEGLVQTTSVRASFMAAWNAGLLPWVSWIAFMLGIETAQRYLRIPRRVTADLAFGAWAGVQLLMCTLCLARASWRLHWSFRSLAAQTPGTRWWKRWLPLRR